MSVCLSVRTVESHRAHIQQKLRLTTRGELVHYAVEHGLMTVSERGNYGRRMRCRSYGSAEKP